jgi:hypothetical protein
LRACIIVARPVCPAVRRFVLPLPGPPGALTELLAVEVGELRYHPEIALGLNGVELRRAFG